jgi:hypothetical protein
MVPLKGKCLSHLGALPNVLRMFGVLFDEGKNAGRDNTVCSTEIAIDFYTGT